MERPECHGGVGMSKPYISSKLREIMGRTEFLRSTGTCSFRICRNVPNPNILVRSEILRIVQATVDREKICLRRQAKTDGSTRPFVTTVGHDRHFIARNARYISVDRRRRWFGLAAVSNGQHPASRLG